MCVQYVGAVVRKTFTTSDVPTDDQIADAVGGLTSPPLLVDAVFVGRYMLLTFTTSSREVAASLQAGTTASGGWGSIREEINVNKARLTLSDDFTAIGFVPDSETMNQLRDIKTVLAAADKAMASMRASSDPYEVIAYHVVPIDQIVADVKRKESFPKLETARTRRLGLLSSTTPLAADFTVPLNSTRLYPDALHVLAYDVTPLEVQLHVTWASKIKDTEYEVTVFLNGCEVNTVAQRAETQPLELSHNFHVTVRPGLNTIEFSVRNFRMLVLREVHFAANKTFISCKPPQSSPTPEWRKDLMERMSKL